MKPITPLTITALALACLPASAQVIGTENFDGYADGPVADLTGGTGWNYDRINSMATGTVSDWDTVEGTPNVVGGVLITDGSSAKREYNGDTEGGGGEDGPETERAGALRGNGLAFYKVDMTYVGTIAWGGLSSYDFGTEKIYYGVINGSEYGIGGSPSAGGFGGTVGTGIAVDNATHTLVAVFDFDRDLVGLWVDPDGADYYYPPDGSNSCDATATYTGTNWNTAVRLGSGNEVHWDNLSVAFDPISVGLQAIVDVDGDSLPDPWEVLHGLNPADDGSIDSAKEGADGDFDGDGLTNAQELAANTNPALVDTDDDGLNDDIEVAGPTDPLNPDTDEDCLTDGEEVNTHGSDPLEVDTDGGGTSDYTEVALGTLPGVGERADDPATNGDPDVIGVDYFDTYGDGTLNGKTGGTGWDYDNRTDTEGFVGHSTKASDWTNIGGAPIVLGGRLVTLGTSIKREFHGGSNNPADVFGESAGAFRSDGGGTGLNNRDVIYVKVAVTRRTGAEWGGGSLYNFGTERIFAGVNGTPPTFALQDSANGAASRLEVLDDLSNPIAPLADETNVIVAKFDFVLNEATMFVNPDLGAAEPASGDPFTATITMPAARMLGTGIRLGSGGSGAVEWDELVVTTTWAALGADGDNDGLPADWEAANGLDDNDDGSIGESSPGAKDGLNGAGGDKDGDGLTNLREYDLGLIPNNDDSDGDGLTDGTGEMAHGTDPLLADTDGDGLKDGDEVNGNNPGSFTSDPTVADTDGDGQSDGGEVLGDPFGATSDPNDANDTVGGPVGLIGCDGFFLPNGPIQDATSGEGFDHKTWLRNGPFTGHTSTFSDWDGDATVTGGQLVTMGTGATRDYNGPGELAGSDAAPTDARMGAVNEGENHRFTVVYFKAELTREAGATTSLIESDDFGTQRVSFGVVQDGEFIEWGIEENGVNLLTDINNSPTDGQTYTMVGKLDYADDLLSLWVDPDLNDTEANNPPLVIKTYTGTNWSSGIRLSSEGTGATAWDNVVVANSWDHLNKVITAPPARIEIIAGAYNAGTGELDVTVNNLPNGDYHIRKSTNGQAFSPFTPGVDITNALAMPIPVPVDPGTSPILLLRVYEGPSVVVP